MRKNGERMQSLADLLNSTDGLRFLESRGVYASLPTFKARLEPPARPDLARTLDAGNSKLVCSGQQLYVDYRQSVVSKILALRDLDQDRALSTFFLWLDTDRAGLDALMTSSPGRMAAEKALSRSHRLAQEWKPDVCG
jgi:hypothetical protein